MPGLHCCGRLFLVVARAGSPPHRSTGPLTAVAPTLLSAGSGAQAQQLCFLGLVALQHVEASQTRDRTHVPCIGRWIFNHGTTSDILEHIFIS